MNKTREEWQNDMEDAALSNLVKGMKANDEAMNAVIDGRVKPDKALVAMHSAANMFRAAQVYATLASS